MKHSEIEPGLYRVKDGKRNEAVYEIKKGARSGTRYRDFNVQGGYSIMEGTSRLHIEAVHIDLQTRQPDPWSTFIRCRDVIAPFTWPIIIKGKQ